jgi:gliding motility-associated-like protein
LAVSGRELIVSELDNQHAGRYYATVFTSAGCIALDSVDVDLRVCELVIPQGISPNNDGFNDQMYIKGLENYPNNGIRIYNRAGSLVYEAKPYPNNFNGEANRNLKGELTQGTYFYMLDLGDGKKPITGYIFLSR